MTNIEAKLLAHFLDDYSDRLSRAGSNDMDQAVFAGLSKKEKEALKSDFDAWDRKANPEDWEQLDFDWISDSHWVGFLRSRLEGDKS